LNTHEKTKLPASEAELVTVSFAAQLQRHVQCPDQMVASGTLQSIFDESFIAAPTMRSYVLDDQGFIRKHVAVFVDGQLHRARHDLSVSIPKGSKIHIIQALSGG
jgi:sulfur-carrier protein